jgi:transcription antitermination factor NusG
MRRNRGLNRIVFGSLIAIARLEVECATRALMAVAYLISHRTGQNPQGERLRAPMANVNAEGTKKWFAVQVRTRWESRAAILLAGKQVETLLPTYTANRRWSDRSRVVEVPLFPGYLFCRFNIHDRLPVLITPGVISVVGRGKTPIAVEESEIAAIQRVILSGIQTQPCPYLEIGERVRIQHDILGGMEGILTSFKGHQRVTISVTLLRRSVALEVDSAWVHPVGPSKIASRNPIAELMAMEKAIA